MLLDIALGLVAALAATETLGVTATWWHLGVGVAFALLPDTDFIWLWMRTRETAAHAGSPEDHRDGLHYPLVYIPVGTLIVATAFSPLVAAIFFSSSLLHFAHDSVGTGWGVKWGWPLSRKNYKCFCEKDGRPSWRLLVSWKPDELRALVCAKGDPDWIKNFFLLPIKEALLFKKAPPLGITILLVIEIIAPVILIAGVMIQRIL